MNLRQRIIEQSSDLFLQQGIKSITMSDIAQNLGISKRTLYEIFPNKEELLEEVFESYMGRTEKEMKEFLTGSDNVIDTLMRIYAKQLSEMQHTNKVAMYDLRKYYPKVYEKVNCEHQRKIDHFIPLFEKGIEQGLIRDDVNVQILLWILETQFKQLMENDRFLVNEYSIREFVREIILTFTRGIATEKGIKVIDEAIVNIEQEIRNKNNKY
jgi:Transcriptional regulator